MNDQTLFYICAIGAVAMVGWILSQLMSNKDGEKLHERLVSRPDAGPADRPSEPTGAKAQASAWFSRLGQAASKPFLPETREKQGVMRKKLSHAGIYSPSAIKTVTGCKVIMMGGGLALGYFAGLLLDSMLLGFSLCGLVGYLAPTMWLKKRIKKQQMALDYGLPDALDLMVVCVEAGLAMDAAMQRVGQELFIAHPAVSKELEIAHMETRVGLSRSEALRNMGARTGNAAMQSLVSMVIQAERFGTSIATALRVHAESLRVQRHHRAEEMASKAAVKMSFPLVLFIFPATFLVLAGPTVVQLMSSPLFN